MEAIILFSAPTQATVSLVAPTSQPEYGRYFFYLTLAQNIQCFVSSQQLSYNVFYLIMLSCFSRYACFKMY